MYPDLLPLRLGAILALCFSLASCGEPAPPGKPQPPQPPGPSLPSAQRSLQDWTIDPEFSLDEIKDAEARAWYQRLMIEIAAEQKTVCPPKAMPPEAYPHYPASATLSACSAAKHYVGRSTNYYVTMLLSNFRLTGDKALLDEAVRVTDIIYERLEDTDGDGFRNLRRIDRYGLNDFNPKEDSLPHGYLAELAYVLEKNADSSTPEHDYAAKSKLWQDYLRQDFEGKWKLQKPSDDVVNGFPQDGLFHPYTEALRYHTYMHKLFPADARYPVMIKSMTAEVAKNYHFDTTPKGKVFVWPHRLRSKMQGGEDPCSTFQMGTYPQQTMLGSLDLALEGAPFYGRDAFVETMSRTMSESILDPGPGYLTYKDVGGKRNGSAKANPPREVTIDDICFKETSNDKTWFRGEGSYASLTWGVWATFAPDEPFGKGEIYRTNVSVYPDPTDLEAPPVRPAIPSVMVFARLYNARGYHLKELK